MALAKLRARSRTCTLKAPFLLAQAREQIAAHDAEQIVQQQAAQELQQALAAYLGQQDSARPEQGASRQRAAVDDSWASLEQRVMGLNMTKMAPRAASRSGERRGARGEGTRQSADSRRSFAMAQTPGRAFRSSFGMAEDPLGVNIGEMVAKVARDRRARCSPSALQPLAALQRVLRLPVC